MSIIGSDRKADPCPLCSKRAVHAFRPFCSQGCRDRDLLNWLGDSYRMPGPPVSPDLYETAEDRLDNRPLRSL